MVRPRYISISQTDRDRFLCGPQAAEARRIIAKLREAGFVAYLAGGCVRDALLGNQPKDYDVATDATPEAVRDLFGRRRTLAFGASFGVIGVLPPAGARRDPDDSGEPTEVATFRSDGTYSDGRRPDSVHFGKADQDALRRDFTINGLFYDPANHQIVDYVGGAADLQRSLLRTIGDATKRIEEDKLRMLRAVRFAATLQFTLEEATIDAIRCHAHQIDTVSGERIGAEMRRVLTSRHAVSGLRHLTSLQLDRIVLPELADLDWTRFEAVFDGLGNRHFAGVLAAMLLAMPSPQKTLSKLAARWKLSGEECRQTRSAVTHAGSIAIAQRLPWSDVQPILVDRDVATIVALAEGLVEADGVPRDGIDLAATARQWPEEKLNPSPLLTGDDLQQLGVPRGPEYRRLLQSLRQAQLDGKLKTREDALGMLDELR